MEVTKLTFKQALKFGYRITSRRYRLATRVDRPDWRDAMAKSHDGGFGWVAALGSGAADQYRRCFSDDHIKVPQDWLKLLPNSGHDDTGYREKK